MPLEVSWRAPPHIYGHVEHRPGDAGNDLRLFMGGALKVHAANGAGEARQRMVDLRDAPAEAKGREFLAAEKP